MMNYQTKSTKVQAMQLEQNAHFNSIKLEKGEWLVVEEGEIRYYSDKDFRDKFEPKPTYTKLDDILGITPANPRWLTSGHKT